MTAALTSKIAAPTPDFSGVEFATSADGMPVARINDLVLAMITSPSTFAYVASAAAVGRPLSELTRADFIGHDGRVANEAEFRMRVAETAGHKHDLATLNRMQTRMSTSPPWAVHRWRSSMLRASSRTVRAATGAFTSLPSAMSKSIRCCGRTPLGTRKIANGRSLPSLFRTSSPAMSAPWRTRPSAIPGRMPGRRSAAASWPRVRAGPRIAGRSINVMRQTMSSPRQSSPIRTPA